MPYLLMLLLALHALSAIFWAGSTFVMARSGGRGAEELFRPQMGAATVVVLTGAILWSMTYGSNFSPSAGVLALGVLTALAAAGVQGALRANPERAHRIAAPLLAITIVCMVTARYVG
jgi:hypothetical protein